MAGFVPNQFLGKVLEAIAGRTSISSTTVYLGLAVSLPEDPATVTLANLIEVTTAGYARKSVPVFDPASAVAPIQTLVSSDFAFNALSEDMVDYAYYAFLTDAPSGTSGFLHYVWELPTPIQGRSGEAIKVPSNQLIIE